MKHLMANCAHFPRTWQCTTSLIKTSKVWLFNNFIHNRHSNPAVCASSPWPEFKSNIISNWHWLHCWTVKHQWPMSLIRAPAYTQYNDTHVWSQKDSDWNVTDRQKITWRVQWHKENVLWLLILLNTPLVIIRTMSLMISLSLLLWAHFEHDQAHRSKI